MAGQVILDAKVAVCRSALSVSLQLIDMFRNTLLQVATNCDGRCSTTDCCSWSSPVEPEKQKGYRQVFIACLALFGRLSLHG